MADDQYPPLLEDGDDETGDDHAVDPELLELYELGEIAEAERGRRS